MEEDWDNLIILDACRFDLFDEVCEIDGSLNEVVSKGSSTNEFLQRQFNDDSYPDTIYISANPHVQLLDIDNKFFRRSRLWESHWDKELRTVPPKAVAEATKKLFENHPNKRYIIHFIQPHYPFIGEKGKMIEHGSITGDGIISDERKYDSIWDRLERGDITEDDVWEAYKENLAITLPHVEDIMSELGGKTVVTSDHGNCFGRWNTFGHPAGRFLEELVKVPWLVQEGERREIINDSHLQQDHGGEKIIKDRLEDLGYV